MKQKSIICWIAALALILTCAVSAEGAEEAAMDYRTDEIPCQNGTDRMIRMTIGGTPVEVAWEDNESVAALRELAANGLSIQMSMYGGFEQVGPVGQRLPSHDVQTNTSSGDIVLYSSSQMVVFYGSNSWAYTRLGRITDKTPEEMRSLLGNGDVTVTLTTK